MSMYEARQRKEKINRTIHKLNTKKKNTELANISRNSYAIQCEKWEKLYENYYIWDKLRNGIRWYGYYYDNVFYFYYVIEDKSKIPENKKENYVFNEKKVFSHLKTEYYLNENIEESDVINNINEKPGFGLELELNDPNLHITTKEAKEEYEIKGHSMKNIANGYVDVTFDTRTGYNSQIANQNLIIELVFDGSKILIQKEEDYSRMKDALINDLKQLKFDDLKESKIGSFVNIERTDSTKSDNVFSDLTNLTFNLHITLALSLNTIGNLMKQRGNGIFLYGIETDKYVSLLGDYESLEKNYDDAEFKRLIVKSKNLNHINSDALAFCEMFYKAFQSHASNDPKQNMEVMNRTSFGKMFSLLDVESKNQVLRFIGKEMDKNAVYSSEHHKITVNDMLNYFSSLNKGEISPSMDPTYHANRDNKAEKMGISQLGNKTEKDLFNKECPIVEIRSVSDKIKLKKIDELDQMIVSIVAKIWPDSTNLQFVRK